MDEVVWHKTSRSQIIVPVNCSLSCAFKNYSRKNSTTYSCKHMIQLTGSRLSNKFESMIGTIWQLRIYYSRRCRNCDLFESSRIAQADELFFNWAIIDVLREQPGPSFGQAFEDAMANFLAIKCSTGKTFQVNTKFFHWYAIVVDQTRYYETEYFPLWHVTNETAAIWVELIHRSFKKLMTSLQILII